jgi:hypothetical protein
MNAWEMAEKISDLLTDEDDPNQWDVSSSAEELLQTAELMVYGEFDQFKITIERTDR